MASVSGWTEGIILSLVFVTILIVAVASFNVAYEKNYNVGFTDNSGAEQLFIDYQDTADEQISGGEIEFDAQQGISLKSSWGLTKDIVKISWSFISGGWIENVVSSWGLGTSGTALGKALRIIYFLSLLFALLYALFKVNF